MKRASEMFLSDWSKSRKEAEATKYNEWAGNPKGTPFNKMRCAAHVWDTGRGALSYQCKRRPAYGPDSLYCKQHAKKIGDVK